MATKRTKDTPGQKLWLALFRAVQYDRQANAINRSSTIAGVAPEAYAKKWLEGMSRSIKETFPRLFREARERYGCTQSEIAEYANLTTNAVAMLERAERAPNLDTAARLCFAIDVAAGVSPEDLE